MLFRVRTSLTAGAAILATASSAAAAAGETAPAPVTGSRLTLAHVAEGGKATQVELTCDPAGGNHPKPVQACAELARVGADPAKLKPADRYCFLLYQPVTARLNGMWRGRAVKWAHQYGNNCEMNRATGVLFDF